MFSTMLEFKPECGGVCTKGAGKARTHRSVFPQTASGITVPSTSGQLSSVGNCKNNFVFT